MPQRVIRTWFDRLELVLHAEAQLAGLLSHGSMIGSAREFFVSRVLKSVLPPSIHIGTGKILAANGRESKQIDVVLYDASFPVFETQPGHGLYLAEGVVAAIEVKSCLDEAELISSLDNCLSVSSMPSSLTTRHVSIKRDRATVRDTPTFSPCTYIFAFQSRQKKTATLCHQVGKWWEAKGFGFDDIHKMPEVVVAGDLLGLASGRWIKLGAEGELRELIEKRHGPYAATVMGFWKVEHRFGWMLTHILTTVAQRFSDERKLVFDRYSPWQNYWEEELAGQPSSHLSAPATVEKLRAARWPGFENQ